VYLLYIFENKVSLL